jgi:hypothetical protein
VAIESCAALEGVEFDDEGVARDGAAGGEKVIDDDDAAAVDGRVEVEFEFVEDGGAVRGKFARLADGDEGEVESLGDGAPKRKPQASMLAISVASNERAISASCSLAAWKAAG